MPKCERCDRPAVALMFLKGKRGVLKAYACQNCRDDMERLGWQISEVIAPPAIPIEKITPPAEVVDYAAANKAAKKSAGKHWGG